MNKKFVIGGIASAVIIIGAIAAATGGGSSTATAAAPAAAPETVRTTVTAHQTIPQYVTQTVTAPPATVTVTAQPAAPAAPAASADPAGPKKNGKYLVGSQIAPGTWQCDKETSGIYWEVDDKTGEIMSNGLDSIAIVPDDGYTFAMNDCSSLWNKVG